MTTPTLPGTIPGLLRPCSPVIVTRGTYAGLRGVVVSIADGIAMVAFDKPSISSLIALGLDDLALDLSDPTGRAHAAWWLDEQEDSVVARAILNATGTSGHGVVSGWLRRWSDGRDCRDNHVRALVNVCLHVAGLTPSPA